MCTSIESNYSCGHRESTTQICRRESRRPCILNRLRRKACKPTLDSSYSYALCFDCIHYWATHGITEDEAMEATRKYKRAHEIYVPLPPGSVMCWYLFDEGEDDFEREQILTTCARQGTSDAREVVSGIITIGFTTPRTQHATRDFELHRPLPAIPDERHESQKGIPVGCRTRRPCRSTEAVPSTTFKSQKRVFPGSRPRRPIAGPAEQDLEKPLPRPPRPDSPHPDARFDSRVPDRNLPSNQYYPRFL